MLLKTALKDSFKIYFRCKSSDNSFETTPCNLTKKLKN